MSKRMTALLTLALVGVLPATAEAAPPTKARQSFVLYDGVAVGGFLNFVPSPSIDTSRFESIAVLARGTGAAEMVCYFTDAPAADPRDAAGVLAFTAAMIEDPGLSNGLAVVVKEFGVADFRPPPMPVLSDNFQCLAHGEGTLSATLVAH